jgi:hypothetical protein
MSETYLASPDEWTEIDRAIWNDPTSRSGKRNGRVEPLGVSFPTDHRLFARRRLDWEPIESESLSADQVTF